MKGMVFTEFLDFVEKKFSPVMVEKLIEQCNLPSGGSYASTGTYDPAEMLSMLNVLSKETKISIPDLLKAYGEALFESFSINYPKFFKEKTTAFQFLMSIEDKIHVEVRKLYPDATLPHFEYQTPDEKTLIMTYTSERPLADLAEGLAKGCINYHKEKITLHRENIPVKKGAKAIFTFNKMD